LARYAKWCQLLRDADIEPMVTLHHFNEPAWFDALGGWELRDNIAFFARFADHVAGFLAPVCGHWCTINELNGFVATGWMAGAHPPGKVNEFGTVLSVLRHLLVAHTQASQAIRRHSAGLKTSISLPLNYIWFTTMSTWSPLSSFISLSANVIYNFAINDALMYGRFPRFPVPLDLLARLGGWQEDVRNLKGTVDVIGVNHYYRTCVSFGFAKNNQPLPSISDLFIALPCRILLRAVSLSNFEKSDMKWDLTPSSVHRILLSLWERYGTPMIITESGIADNDESEYRRTRYLSGVLTVMSDLLKQGVQLKGFLIWTLLDNFEWAEGFRPRFGLVHTNFETFERTKRATTCEMIRRVFQGS